MSKESEAIDKGLHTVTSSFGANTMAGYFWKKDDYSGIWCDSAVSPRATHAPSRLPCVVFSSFLVQAVIMTLIYVEYIKIYSKHWLVKNIFLCFINMNIVFFSIGQEHYNKNKNM